MTEPTGPDTESLGYGDTSEDEQDDAQQIAQNLEQVRSDFQTVFGTPVGKDVFRYLYHFCGQIRSSYTRPSDPVNMAFKEGKRNVILEIMRHLHTDDLAILEEARERSKRKR